jgi:hypothetical protein
MSSSRESSPIRVRPAAIVLGCALALATAALPAQERRGRDDEPLLITQRMRDAVERGHEWLAAAQHPDGYWSQDVGFKLNQDYRLTEADKPHVGVTALALMSFLAGGHLPGRGKYGDNIDRGLDYVLSCVRENGYITDWGSRMYSHAFATLFLAEIYGMTRRTDVRRALQDAVNIIVDSQNSEGGWRYKPFARESDMSITVCQVLALRSSRNVGITVSARTIRDAENYVRRSAVTGTNARGASRDPQPRLRQRGRRVPLPAPRAQPRDVRADRGRHHHDVRGRHLRRRADRLGVRVLHEQTADLQRDLRRPLLLLLRPLLRRAGVLRRRRRPLAALLHAHARYPAATCSSPTATGRTTRDPARRSRPRSAR